MSNFSDRLKTGELGETLVKQWLEDTGYIIYSPETEGRHWIDVMAHDNLKQSWVACEVKNKDRMDYYNATGINTTALMEYQNLEKTNNMNVLLFFVDASLKQIYHAPLQRLMMECVYSNVKYPNFDIARNKVLFPLESMETIKNLTDEEVKEIKESRLN